MGKLDDSIKAADDLINLIDSTQTAFNNTLNQGKEFLQSGKENVEYAKKITNWVGSGQREQEEAQRAILNQKKAAFKRRYRILWFLILVATILICIFL